MKKEESNTVQQSPCWVMDKDIYEAIYKNFQPIYTGAMTETISFFNPEPITQHLPPDNKVTVGVVCVNDAYDYLKEAWWLLHNAFCFLAYIKNSQKNEIIFIPRIYGDDTCLRLYSSAEHLASAIVKILGIDSQKIKSDETKSLASRVGNYFLHELSEHKLSGPIKKLMGTKEWQTVIRWRNDWVHNKRVIPSESAEYKRHNLWKKTDETTSEMSMGPKRQIESDYQLEEILKTTLTALNTYIVCFNEITIFLKEFILNDIFEDRLIFHLENQVAHFKYKPDFDVKPFEP